MEIYKDLSNPASQEFEKLLNSQLSKIQIEEGKIIEGKINKITEKFVFLFVEGLKSEPVLDVNQLKIAIVRGLGGREFLANTLRSRGAEVDYFEVYRRNPTRHSAAQLFGVIQKSKINVVSITSGDSLENLNRLLLADKNPQQNWHGIPVIVPSERVLNLAQRFGFKNIRLASGADVESTIIALQELAIEADKLDSSK